MNSLKCYLKFRIIQGPEMALAHPGDPAGRKPTPQVVHGTAHWSEAVVFRDLERIPETIPKSCSQRSCSDK